MSTAAAWVARDARRVARQLWRRIRPAVRARRRKDLPPSAAATVAVAAVTAAGLVFAAATGTWWLAGWIVGWVAAAWVFTAPTRHMLRPRLRAAFRDFEVDPPPRISWWLFEPADGRLAPAVRHRPYGTETTVTIPAGSSIEQLDAYRPKIRAALDCLDVHVTRHPTRGGHATLAVWDRWPWTPGEQLAWPWVDRIAAGDPVSVWDPMPVAVDAHHQPLHWQLCVPDVGAATILVGGARGTGKSTFLHLPAAAAAADPTCTPVMLDGKYAELHAWRDACRWFVGFDVTEAIAALEWVDKWVDQRLLALAKTGRRVCQPGDPTLLLLCDEWGTYSNTIDPAGGERFNKLAQHIVQRGRAAGVIAVFAAQKAAAHTVPTATRDLLDLRAGFRANTREASDMVNGPNQAAAGRDSTKIPIDQRGVAWFTNPATDIPELAKSYALADADIARIATTARTRGEPERNGQNGVKASRGALGGDARSVFTTAGDVKGGSGDVGGAASDVVRPPV